ncbi:MAG: FAD-binding oxidoreductase [Deltaproteobacteria bacterium]|nr:FAD-binding oxidoreductase [Deltaproteobacteria bacterium]
MPFAPVTSELVRELSGVVGQERVSTDEGERAVYGRDMWPRYLIGARYGSPPKHRPGVVVWPRSTREVAAVVKIAREARVPVVPYGGGSGVCGGAVPLYGGITIDVKRMDKLLSVSRDEQVCDVEAGMNGERFERELGRRGYTVGNFPSSIYCSTVGGWLACRAAGQMSTKYGKIEDRVVGLTVVTGRGEIIETDHFARASRGPNWTQLLVGSEGVLGIITQARLRLSAVPEIRIFRGFEFPDTESGIEAIRRVMQRGLRPAVVRLYDEVDTLFNAISIFKSGDEDEHDRDRFAPIPDEGDGALPRLPQHWDEDGKSWSSGLAGLRKKAMGLALGQPKLLNSFADSVAQRVSRRGCKMIIGLEGSRIRTEVESRLAFSELEHAGGRDVGEEPGRDWFEHRYAVSYKMSKVFREGAFVDTMEVASTWERLLDLYHAVREAIGRHAVVMAHFSHAYPDGCSIYFTFAARGEDKSDSERIYDAIWRDGLGACSRVGGTISHHHGVGLLKGRYMAAEHRESMRILAALKSTLDPEDIMNPGKLGLAVKGSR